MLLNIIVSERRNAVRVIIVKCVCLDNIGFQVILQLIFLIAIVCKMARTTLLDKLLNLT